MSLTGKMAHTVTMELTTQEDFRENYQPEPVYTPEPRHWMLDFPAGRNVLLSALRKSEGHISRSGEDVLALDERLEVMVDLLGLREMKQPTTNAEKLKVNLRCLKLIAMIEFGKIKIS